MSPLVIDPDEARKEYDSHANNYERMYIHHISDVQQMVATTQVKSTDMVLDLGTGIGWLAQEVGKNCAFVVGIDISGRCIAKAKNITQGSDAKNVFFAVADMTDAQQIQEVTSQIIDAHRGLLMNTAHKSPAEDQAPRFDVVFLCWAFMHVAPELQVRFLTMLRDQIVRPGGRLVLDHQTTRSDMQTIEAFAFCVPPGSSPWDIHAKRIIGKQVGKKTGLQKARQELAKIADSAGWRITRSEGLPLCDAKPGSLYRDCTEEVNERARKMFPDKAEKLGFKELEKARMYLFKEIPAEVEIPGTLTQVQKYHKVAAIMAVLELPGEQ